MSVYYSIDEALNSPRIPAEWSKSIIVGHDEICHFIGDLIIKWRKTRERICLIALDGFLGIEWNGILCGVEDYLGGKGLKIEVMDFDSVYESSDRIEQMISSCLSLRSFGRVFKGRLENLLNVDRLKGLESSLKDRKETVRSGQVVGVICHGCGAALSRLREVFDYVFYLDLTREELFNRSLKRPVHPLGSRSEGTPVHLDPKRLYYVDFPVLNRHKRYVLKHMDWYVDCNIIREPKLLPRDLYENVLSTLAKGPFMIKPLYYPVSWGGKWLREIKNLPSSMANSGQSCILPWENSVRIRVGDTELEIPFLNLMWNESIRIMGEYASRKFQGDLPMAYYYDDGCGGGNMAIQVHPNTAYIKKHFNESLRQDESYYILYAGEEAKTYLGLKEEVDVDEFHEACDNAERNGKSFEYEKYVNSIATKRGDYFLIPAGTIHASGRNQVVLEIDGCFHAYAPGYTFHFYDYLRPDLDGSLRSIHLEHAFNVLKTNRRTKWVSRYLKQKPMPIRSGDDWVENLVGKQRNFFFRVHLVEFLTKVEDDTRGMFHILTLVDGEKVMVQTNRHQEEKHELKFTETIIIPACLGKYTLVNLGNKTCKITKALPS